MAPLSKEEEYEIAARAAFDKAQEHLSTAECIAEASNFSLAFSHIIIGLEEWMKELIFEGVKLGVIEIGKPDASNPLRIPKRDLYSHKHKQAGVMVLLLMLIPVLGRNESIMSARAESREITRGELTNRLTSDMETVKSLLLDFDKLEDMKQAGLYSGERGASGRLTKPAGKEEYERYHKVLNECLEVEEHSYKNPRSPYEIEQLKKDAKEFKNEILSKSPLGDNKSL